MTFETLESFLKYLYDGNFDEKQDLDHLMALFKAADLYNVQSLQKQIATTILKGINVDNVIDVILFTDLHCILDGVQKEAIRFAADNFKEVLVHHNWKNFATDFPELRDEILAELDLKSK